MSYQEQASGEYLFRFIWSPLAFVLAIGVALVTVFLSALFPARKVGKIPALYTIRGMGEVQVKKKRVSESKVVAKIFGSSGVLARIFLKRSKRNFRATVIAMSFSIAIFIVAGGFYDQMNRFADLQWGDWGANVGASLELAPLREVNCDEDDYWERHWRYDSQGNLLYDRCYEAVNVAEVAISVADFRELQAQIQAVLHEEDILFGSANSGRSYQTLVHKSQLASEMSAIISEMNDWVFGDYFSFYVIFIVVDDDFAEQLAHIAGVEVGSNILINHVHWYFQERLMVHELLEFDNQSLTVRESGNMRGNREI